MPHRLPARLFPSIRRRLLFLVLVVAVPAAVLVAALTKRAYDSQREEVARHLVVAARAVALLAE